jgi:meso-butanediol dehydrogenase / (S,S)-butanediol dehydrogenase / diacetyl reductase
MLEPEMPQKFAGKVVVVTGSGRQKGLGQGILQRFADEGAHCVVSDVAVDDEAHSVAADLRARGADVAVIACDVSNDGACKALVAQSVERFGRLDIMINNAGIGYLMKPLLETSWDDWKMVLDVNLGGAFSCSKYAALQMVAQGTGGRIINIASQAAKSGFPHMAPYCASKHGMIGLTRANAVELGKHGITVNAVCPNHVTTGLGAKQNDYFSKLLGFESVAAYLQNMAAKNPMGRPGLPADTAAVCAFLASDEAFYLNGEALNVTGGEEMH